MLLPVQEYFPGVELPPHLSPWAPNDSNQYVPPEKHRLLAMMEGKSVAPHVYSENKQDYKDDDKVIEEDDDDDEEVEVEEEDDDDDEVVEEEQEESEEEENCEIGKNFSNYYYKVKYF